MRRISARAGLAGDGAYIQMLRALCWRRRKVRTPTARKRAGNFSSQDAAAASASPASARDGCWRGSGHQTKESACGSGASRSRADSERVPRRSLGDTHGFRPGFAICVPFPSIPFAGQHCAPLGTRQLSHGARSTKPRKAVDEVAA